MCNILRLFPVMWGNFLKIKKNFLYVLDDRSKYPLRQFLLMRPALFHFLVEFFQQENCFRCFWWFFFTHVSDFLAFGYRSESCAYWSSPLTPFVFLIFSLSAQSVRHFALISSNLGSGSTKLTLVIFWRLKKILFMS